MKIILAVFFILFTLTQSLTFNTNSVLNKANDLRATSYVSPKPLYTMNNLKWGKSGSYQTHTGSSVGNLLNVAQAYADSCPTTGVHNPKNSVNKVGENLCYKWTNELITSNLENLINECQQNWFDESQYYSYGNTYQCKDQNGKEQVCGHYTQVVRQGVTAIACAISRCSGADKGYTYRYYTVCNYDNQNKKVKPYTKESGAVQLRSCSSSSEWSKRLSGATTQRCAKGRWFVYKEGCLKSDGTLSSNYRFKLDDEKYSHRCENGVWVKKNYCWIPTSTSSLTTSGTTTIDGKTHKCSSSKWVEQTSSSTTSTLTCSSGQVKATFNGISKCMSQGTSKCWPGGYLVSYGSAGLSVSKNNCSPESSPTVLEFDDDDTLENYD